MSSRPSIVLVLNVALALVFGVIVGVVGGGVSAAEEGTGTFSETLAAFGTGEAFEANFEEEKYLALLAAPLQSRGKMYFNPPSTLLRRVVSPRPQDILVTKSHVRITDASGDQVVDLSGLEAIRPLIESMIWIFTGNLESLERTYEIDYRAVESGDEGLRGWEVDLVPRESPLSDLVRVIRVTGRGAAAESIELIEATGDRTVTRISMLRTRVDWGDAELREFFGTGPP